MLKRLLKFLIKSLLLFFVLTISWVLLYKYVPVGYTPLMAIRSMEGDDSYQTRHQWTPIKDISTNMQLSVICAEDQQFLLHDGFDYEAIKKAYNGNKMGQKLKGGSTISQQTAKNVFLWPQRSWFRKGMETYFTFLIETFWSKERILEVYLNSIEMGPGVFGVEAAATYWFETSADDISRHEAASIAAILPNPRVYKASPRTAYLEGRKQWILRQMNNFGTFNIAKNE